jgi:HKD family nuclease
VFYSNLNDSNGHIEAELTRAFTNASVLRIAVGYVATDTIEQYARLFFQAAENGGLVQILVGMAFFDGLNVKKKNALEHIDYNLREIDDRCGIYVPFSRRFHGKIYCAINDDSSNFYIGSHNFSQNAFKLNIESSVRVSDADVTRQIEDLLNNLFSPASSVHINDAEIPVKGIPAKTDNVLETATIPFTPLEIEGAEWFEIDMTAVSRKEKSNLNVYFGEGRWSRSTGKIAPRPWYEIELINPIRITNSACYPKGAFTLYTSDGFCLPMATNGDYNKNMRSRGGLQIFGLWLKGKLEKARALEQYSPVTSETFEIYGKDIMRIYKITDGIYYTDF